MKNVIKKLLIFIVFRNPAKGIKIKEDRKVEILLSYRNEINIFVETGTNLGYTTNAMKNSFEEIYSIELDIEKFNQVVARFVDEKKIHLYHGDSGEKIYEVMTEIKGPALIWLDAHDSSFDLDNSPVREELDAVFSHSEKGHVVIIDDARHFTMKDIREINKIARHYRYHCVIDEGIIRLTPIVK